MNDTPLGKDEPAEVRIARYKRHAADALLAACFCVFLTVTVALIVSAPAWMHALESRRECIVIDMRTKPGPGRIVPADPSI